MAERRFGRGRPGGQNPRREARARAAEQHTDEVRTRLAKDIERSLAGVARYDGAPKPKKAPVAEKVEPAKADEAIEPLEADEAAVPREVEEAPSPELPAVSVVDMDSVAAVLENGRGYAQFCDLALLDFASFTNPGGGYIRGAWAQEEALCAESYLFNVLEQQRDWYQENRRRNINCELYRDRALVVPAVRFERGKMHAYADVIVVAAPNARRALEEYRVTDEQLERAMRDRIRLVLAIMDDLGREKAVLGAFGCGVFGWDAERVAEMFRQELASGDWGVKQVIFAVPQTRFDENLAKFRHVLDNFPEAPAMSFAEAAAAAAKVREAEEASAADDDEDEDDWRKYL